jgi:hypothetical protein
MQAKPSHEVVITVTFAGRGLNGVASKAINFNIQKKSSISIAFLHVSDEAGAQERAAARNLS